jgi:hypothetical protein
MWRSIAPWFDICCLQMLSLLVISLLMAMVSSTQLISTPTGMQWSSPAWLSSFEESVSDPPIPPDWIPRIQAAQMLYTGELVS